MWAWAHLLPREATLWNRLAVADRRHSIVVARRFVDAYPLALVDSFFRVGSLVFGGGHVVLPFLEDAVVGQGWCTRDDFSDRVGAPMA